MGDLILSSPLKCTNQKELTTQCGNDNFRKNVLTSLVFINNSLNSAFLLLSNDIEIRLKVN